MRISGCLALCLLVAGCKSNIKTNPDVVAALVEEGKTPIARKPNVQVEAVETALNIEPEVYRIGVGDVLHVTVAGRPEFNPPPTQAELVGFRVHADGKIYVPMVEGIEAAGASVAELRTALNQAISEFVKKPQVGVEVLRYESQKFFVLGHVTRPGVFAANGTMTLLEAIGNAGGITALGDVDGAYLIRGGKLMPVSLGDILLRGDTRRNLVMRRGDMVYVPDKTDWKVYVLGEVREPGIVPMGNRGLNLADAIANVGGIDKLYADRNVIRIFRGGWQKARAFTLSIEDVYQFGSSIALRPGDRIVVAPSSLANFNRATTLMLPFLQSAVTAGTVAVAATN